MAFVSRSRALLLAHATRNVLGSAKGVTEAYNDLLYRYANADSEWIGGGDRHFLERAERRMERLVDRSSILVIASHSPDLIEHLCNRAILLEHGRVIVAATPEGVLSKYRVAA